ncbi:MAG TPA: DeoR/GlpR family DNA-binding transcription regulator [Chthoniobacterales bacterium]|jgi:DeoR/GlpR family transcriptional regulator of sugar metabolism|nr:DeoR/GlpR family DNA-binding transcription regulator [Chthoniobacterales bacterium]
MMQKRDLMPAERQKEILERIRKHGRVLATDLAREFSTSEDTIRRALRDLAAQGLCARVYGGALAISPASGTSLQRRREAVDRKLALGQKMASIIQPGQFLFIDAGTTNLAVARSLPKSIGLSVATHDPTIAAVLADRTDLTLITIGGQINPLIGAAVDGQALRQVLELRLDLLLLGVCAIDANDGLAAFHSEDAQMKRALLERSGSVAIAVLNEKLSTSAPFQVAPVDVVADLVVEADAPKQFVSGFESRGMRVHRAKTLNANRMATQLQPRVRGR